MKELSLGSGSKDRNGAVTPHRPVKHARHDAE